MKVLLIIPAHNEAENLPSLLECVKQFQQYNVVIVDDASTDNTAQVGRSYGVPVIQLAANLGIGGAVQTGFKYAVRSDYDVVVQVDGDGQHDPAWVETLLKPIVSGEADCVIGSRYMRDNPDTSYETPLLRRVGMLFSTTILFFATGLVVTDTTSGFRALNRRAYEYFAREYPVDHPEAETILLLHRAHYITKEVPVKMHGRQAGNSLFTWGNSTLYPFRVLVGFAGIFLRNRGGR